MPKILICTIDAWNSKLSASSSNTFSALFSQYDAQDLANVYIREEFITVNRIARFYGRPLLLLWSMGIMPLGPFLLCIA